MSGTIDSNCIRAPAHESIREAEREPIARSPTRVTMRSTSGIASEIRGSSPRRASSMSAARFMESRISTSMAPGSTTAVTVNSGALRPCRWDGPPTVMVGGSGSSRGVGRGSTTPRGVGRPFTMDDGSSSTAPGTGHRAPSLPARSTRLPSLDSTDTARDSAGAHRSPSASARVMSVGSRWAGASPVTRGGALAALEWDTPGGGGGADHAWSTM